MNTEDNKNSLVLFDIWGVLCEVDSKAFHNELFSLSKNPNSVDWSQLIAKQRLEDRWTKQEICAAEYCQELSEIINTPIQPSQLEKPLKNFIGEKIQDVVNFKRAIYAAGYSVGIFCNITKELFFVLLSKYPEIFQDTSSIIMSWDIGFLKPEREMYDIVKGFQHIVLIDDNYNYIKPGVEYLGWKGIHFTPYHDLRQNRQAISPQYISSSLEQANTVTELKEALDNFEIKI